MADDPRPNRQNSQRAAAGATDAELRANAALAGDQPDAVPRVRPKDRKPFGTTEQKLAHPPIPGFHLHWFNDDPGRIERAKKAGYEHVQSSDGKPLSMIVGVGRDNNGLTAYLMKIPQEWYEDDIALEQKRVSDLEGSITRGEVEGKGLDRSKDGQRFYVGASGIQVRQTAAIRR